MLQFLPLIMNMLSAKQKDEQARNQNSAAAMLGQAPTAQGGNMAGALGGAMEGLQKGLSDEGRGRPTRSKGLSADTNNMLDEGLGGPAGDVDDDDLLSM